MAATKDTLFNPAKLTSQQKIAQTDGAARQIIDAELAAREKKTERLKKLRLEQEAAAAENAPAKPAAKKAKRQA
ncbi:hypothetical protein JJB09_02775 [Rhizobium sp. KVB221]|uniref:Uncharacterized protein n=1 Tax=Rhizobium setariae TaxID=2801340 RepID=A0A937CNQ6_9HYPH|nr:hypothetical protein [Rhizobium setariae]MBL0370942.1 hypothetical protein [Rhizobium setariae]